MYFLCAVHECRVQYEFKYEASKSYKQTLFVGEMQGKMPMEKKEEWPSRFTARYATLPFFRVPVNPAAEPLVAAQTPGNSQEGKGAVRCGKVCALSQIGRSATTVFRLAICPSSRLRFALRGVT